MRTLNPTLRLVALLSLAAAVAACGGGGEAASSADSAAAAAAAPPPPPDSYTLAGDDGSWSADITPGGIVWRQKKGAKMDSLVFDFKAPNVNGAISEYESLRTGADTTRLSISVAMVKCTPKSGEEYTHKAQLWLTGKTSFTGSGCAKKQ